MVSLLPTRLRQQYALYVSGMICAITLIACASYAILGLQHKAPVNPAIFLGAQTVYFLANSLLLYVLWMRRTTLSFMSKVFLIAWAAVTAWYTLPMAILHLLTVTVDNLQLKWLMFAWMWELPVFGAGLVGLYAFIFALPFDKLVKTNFATPDPAKTYKQIVRYPLNVAAGMVIIAGISFSTGAIQLGFFAYSPFTEQIKMILFGLSSSIFFSIFMYLAYDYHLRTIRQGFEKVHGQRHTISRSYAGRIFVITLLISFGALVMVSLVVVRSYQQFIIQKTKSEGAEAIQRTITHLEKVPEAVYSDALVASIKELTRRPEESVLVLSNNAQLSGLALSVTSREQIIRQASGSVTDVHDTFKVISFGTDARHQQKILMVTQVGNFYTPISASIQFFVLGGCFIMLLTASVTSFASSHLSDSIKQLSNAVRRAQGKDEAFTFDTYTADELEELAHSFTFYINEARQLRQTLEQKVEERTAALLRVENEKRSLEVAAAEREIQDAKNQRAIAQELAAQLEGRVEQRTAQLEEALERLKEVDKLKSEFVSIASHQLRTPLTVVRWAYHALLDDKEPPLSNDQKQMASAGLKKTLFMIRLVNELLDVARIEQNTFGMRQSEVALDRLLLDIIDEQQEGSHTKNVTLRFERPDKRLPTVLLDGDKIRIALTNIIDNAIKYSKPHGHIDIGVKWQASSVVITVADKGIGIPADQVRRLFTRFFRGSNAPAYHTDGSGLGLYIAKTIIEKQGGVISAQSEEGKGTTFTITLPTTGKKSRSGQPA